MRMVHSTMLGLLLMGIHYCSISVPHSCAQENIQSRKSFTSVLDSIKTAYEKKLQEVSNRVAKLEKAEADKNKQDELQKLLESAKTLSQETKKEEATIARVFRGGQRQMQALNPNISLTGDVYGSYTSSRAPSIRNGSPYSDGRNRFFLREAEFHVIAPLDPFTRGKFFLGIPGDGDDPLSFMIGEAYMEWLNMPGSINLKIGYFNNQFGLMNRYHDHGLPQVDRPRALVNLFGLSNFGGVGIASNILLPRLWAHVNELDIEVITGGGGVSFDDDRENVIVVSHLKNYYDLNRDTYLEIGLSGAHGFNQTGVHETTLGSVDLTLKWSPANRSHYRTIEFRSEYFFSLRETMETTLKRNSFYSYLTAKTGAWTWVGIRFSYSELPFAVDKLYEWDISPYLDFWQSEFVMLRLQYSYTSRSFDENDHAVFLQTVWSMGPHKHEAY